MQIAHPIMKPNTTLRETAHNICNVKRRGTEFLFFVLNAPKRSFITIKDSPVSLCWNFPQKIVCGVALMNLHFTSLPKALCEAIN